MTLEKNTLVHNRYRIVEILGQGGMGTVYHGIHSKTNDPYAIKVIAASMAKHQRFRRRFDAEFEGEGTVADVVWIPAWVLCETPALATRLGQAQTGLQGKPERAMRRLLDLLHLERQGRQRDLLAQRRQQRDLQPVLYAAYMKSR